jgi:hypothetical protein
MMIMIDTWSVVNIKCEIMPNWFDTNGWMFVLPWKNQPHSVTSSGVAVVARTFLVNGKKQCMICPPCSISEKIKLISNSMKSSFYLIITGCHFSPPICCTNVSLPSDKQQLSHAIRNLHKTSTLLSTPIMLHCSLTNLHSSLWVNETLYQKC